MIFISNKDFQINDEIRDKQVRLIGQDGKQLGIMDIEKAQQIAADTNLDLVKIAPKANPPVCKVMDYGKFKFEAAKREKENRKNQKVIEIKEVRLSPSIDKHDFETKLNAALRFLKAGSKVKVTVRFRGREIHHLSLGSELLKKFAAAADDYGTVEKNAKLEGRNMALIMAPKENK